MNVSLNEVKSQLSRSRSVWVGKGVGKRGKEGKFREGGQAPQIFFPRTAPADPPSSFMPIIIIIIIKKVKIIVTLSIKNTAGALYNSHTGVTTVTTDTTVNKQRTIHVTQASRLYLHLHWDFGQ